MSMTVCGTAAQLIHLLRDSVLRLRAVLLHEIPDIPLHPKNAAPIDNGAGLKLQQRNKRRTEKETESRDAKTTRKHQHITKCHSNGLLLNKSSRSKKRTEKGNEPRDSKATRKHHEML
jgi:hypothetical protein